jgi:beta-lactamase class A
MIGGGSKRVAPLLVLLLAARCASAGRPASSEIDRTLAAASARCGCRMRVAAKHLESGRSYEHLADAEFEGASVTKIAVLTEAMAAVKEGRIDLEARWTLTETDKADGSGLLILLNPGLEPTWNDLLTLMIGPSDNTATNAWIERLGLEAINARMEILGFRHIRLLGTLPPYSRHNEIPSAWKGFRFGTLTPRQVALWYERAARGELLDSDSSRKIIAYLDKDPSRLRAARRFPSEDLWAGKTGTMSGVRNDSRILRTKKGRFVLVLLTDGGAVSRLNSADNPATLAIADVAQTIVEAWSRDLPDRLEKPE